jgi:D-glycero-D-manno-heptose 1,7-bisphosphate phosphatase
MNRAVFLDRDGVINERAVEGEYITRWEDMRLLPGTAEAISLLNGAGFRVTVVTNQRCVAKGLLTVSDLELMHDRMRRKLAAAGATVDDIYYCPHDKQASCNCRKPSPGMLVAAARAHQVDLAASWMIGDSDIDMEAGRKAGCKTARILSCGDERPGTADIFASSLPDAVGQILLQQS